MEQEGDKRNLPDSSLMCLMMNARLRGIPVDDQQC